MYGGLRQSCTICRAPGSADLRSVWGCDRPVKQATWSTSCAVCAGRDPDCVVCDGSGDHRRYRCPSVEMGAVCGGCGGSDSDCPECHGRFRGDASVTEMMTAYLMLDRFHVLPRPGGSLDQHPRFIKAVQLIDSERGKIQKRDQDEQDARAKAASRKARRGR